MTARAAVVLKSEKNKIIVLTADGEFRSVRWRAPLPELGEEVVLRETALAPRQFLAVALAAAFLLVAVLPSVAWALKPAAYIALDINPSIGLEVARSGRIKSGEGLNDEGKELLQQVAVKGLLPPEAVEKLVRQAAREGFVTGSADDVIVISQVHLQSAPLPTLPELEAAADRALLATGKEAFVAVEEASSEELQEARQQSTSLNTVRLLKKLSDISLKQSPSNNSQPKEKITQESLKEILADSGKKAAEVFQQGSLKGKPEKAGYQKGGPEGKPPGADKANTSKPPEKMPNNRKPSPAKPDRKKTEPPKPDVTQPKWEKAPDDKKDKDKPLIKPPGLYKKGGVPTDPKSSKPKLPKNKSDKNGRLPEAKPSQGKGGRGPSSSMLLSRFSL